MEDSNMKRTYIKPHTATVAASDEPLCTLQSWAAGKYDPDNKQVDVDDPLTDMGKVITDKDLKTGDYDPWDSKNW